MEGTLMNQEWPRSHSLAACPEPGMGRHMRRYLRLAQAVRCALEPGPAAAAAERREQERYSGLWALPVHSSGRGDHRPIWNSILNRSGTLTLRLLRNIGGRISAATKDSREPPWLRQRISIATIHGNSAATLATVSESD